GEQHRGLPGRPRQRQRAGRRGLAQELTLPAADRLPCSNSVTISAPFSVSSDSGWNCTPAKPGPRSACTSPSPGSRLTSIPCSASSPTTSPEQQAVKEL